ncbi:hypothetical protein [Planktotalea sp.]|uniref:hypothetical protein n=1 Tax=Planktotalea sp. TaxID=2029877 RepID=UPI0035C86017
MADPESLVFSKLIDFEDVLASLGLRSLLDEILVRDGATFGERFAGQSRLADGDFDMITGKPQIPLTVLDGGEGQTLGAMHVRGSIVIHGQGPRVYPKVEAVGEGAIAVLFERDQPALAFDIAGGELGYAKIQFIRRDGSEIDTVTFGPLAERSYAFTRKLMQPDIAGFILLNTDPQGISVDNLRFESFDLMG